MTPASVRMTIEWLVPPEETRPMTMALHAVAADTRAARGCLSCSVSADLGKGGAVRYVEDWRTEDDLRRRLKADSFSQLIAVIEHASQAPQIAFALEGGTRGLDFVDEVRGTAM